MRLNAATAKLPCKESLREKKNEKEQLKKGKLQMSFVKRETQYFSVD